MCLLVIDQHVSAAWPAVIVPASFAWFEIKPRSADYNELPAA